jgi:hypothetical protein
MESTQKNRQVKSGGAADGSAGEGKPHRGLLMSTVADDRRTVQKPPMVEDRSAKQKRRCGMPARIGKRSRE